jgi:hypothetical protein
LCKQDYSIRGGKVACSTQSQLHVINERGDETATLDVPDRFVIPPNNRGTVYFSGSEGDLKCLSLQGGTPESMGRPPLGYDPLFFMSLSERRSVVVGNPQKKIKVNFLDSFSVQSRRKSLRGPGCTSNVFTSQNCTPLDIFISTREGRLYSISLDGKVNWNRDFPSAIDCGDEYKHTLAVGSRNGRYVKAFDLRGEKRKPHELWTKVAIGRVSAVMIPNDRTVLAGTENFGGRLYSFRATDGEEMFVHEMPKDFGIWSMAYKKGVLYLGTGIGGKGRVYAVDYKALKID